MKILICGYYGNQNLGDEAMLAGMIQLLKKHSPDVSLSVLSDNPKYTAALHSIDPVEHPKRFRRRFGYTIETLKNQSLILGGGDLLRDNIDFSVAKSWLIFLERAIRLHRRTFVLGISVGEIWRQETKDIIPLVLNKVDLIAVRDQNSKKILKELGVSKDIYVMSDLALFGLPKSEKRSLPNSEKLRVGISVRPLIGRGKSVDLGIYPQFQQNVAAIADYLVEQHNAEVHFFPFHAFENKYHSSDDDYISALEVLRYSRNSENFVVHRYIDSLEKLYFLIGQLDLMIGTRLHSLILAAGLGVPIIAAEYDPKIKGFMQEIKQDDLSIPLQDFNLAQLTGRIEAIFENLTDARQKIVSEVESYQSRSSAFSDILAAQLK